MAAAYRKLGDAQAKAIYERVVRECGDQAASARIARAALASATDGAATARSTVTAVRRVWAGEVSLLFGAFGLLPGRAIPGLRMGQRGQHRLRDTDS
jgi:hypothetical protein